MEELHGSVVNLEGKLNASGRCVHLVEGAGFKSVGGASRGVVHL